MARDGVGVRCAADECALPPLDIRGSNNAVLAISLRRCRTTAYTSSAASRFPTMRLSPRPFGSRSGGRLGVICPELRPPLVAIHSVRDTAHTFASYGSRQRDIMGKVHFASSTVHSPWTALRVRWVPLYCLSGRSAARATVGGEFPSCTLSVVQRVPRSTVVHVSASPPLIPDGRISRVRLAAVASPRRTFPDIPRVKRSL